MFNLVMGKLIYRYMVDSFSNSCTGLTLRSLPSLKLLLAAGLGVGGDDLCFLWVSVVQKKQI